MAFIGSATSTTSAFYMQMGGRTEEKRTFKYERPSLKSLAVARHTNKEIGRRNPHQDHGEAHDCRDVK